MRLILSRKGFDSASGGCASPLVDGRPISLPIPTGQPTATTFGSIGGNLAEFAHDLTAGRISSSTPCHLDPDLDVAALPRSPQWRGALGQVGAAQSHLSKQSVQQGDLFLFWGLFRPVSRRETESRWVFAGPREHRIFGWLQVGDILAINDDPTVALKRYPWLKHHPHVRTGWPESNTVYIAAEHLTLRVQSKLPGYGLFRRGHRLTADKSELPSRWAVPAWLDPTQGGVGMTYHPPPRWVGGGCLLAAARGQEFVANITGRADAFAWLHRVFESSGASI